MTLAPPRPHGHGPEASPAPPPAPARPEARRTGTDASLLLAEVALTAVTLSAVLGLLRLFDGPDALPRLVLTTLAAHGLAAATRRLGWGVLATGAVALVGGVAVIIALPHTETLWGGFWPTGESLDALRADVRESWEVYADVRAPTPALPGFVAGASALAWFLPWLADRAAFSVRTEVEPVIPAMGVLVFASVLADGRQRGLATFAYAATALTFIAIQRARLRRGWLQGRRLDGRLALASSGVALALVATAVGVLAAPHLPMVGNDPILDWRDVGGDPDRVTISPLVDIRGRLVDQSTVEVFQVRSDSPAYWRLTSLNQFDGTVWSAEASYAEADGRLRGGLDDRLVDTTTIQQQYTVKALHSLWVPAAFEPTYVESPNNVRYDRRSGTLIVSSSSPSSDGMTYNVASRQPALGPEDFDLAGGGVPDQIRRDNIALPEGFPDLARRMAAEAVEGARTPYERARRLQDWFRTEFTYDLETVRSGHDEGAILRFISNRRGYCEQFAGTYAAMARSLGIPSRVAVGFTPGDRDSEDPNLYRVKGKHAHAWPEVYLANVGWVAFEPTPGRGQPGADRYTGVAPAQDSAPFDPTPATSVPASTIPSLDSIPDRLPNEDVRTVAPPDSTSTREPDRTSPVLGRAAWALLWAAVAGVIWVVALNLGRALRRRRAHQRAATAAARVRATWAETADQVRAVTPAARSSETHTEFASRAARALGDSGADLTRLADLTTSAAWAGQDLDPGTVDEAHDLGHRVRRAAWDRRDRRSRLLALVDPRRPAPLRR